MSLTFSKKSLVAIFASFYLMTPINIGIVFGHEHQDAQSTDTQQSKSNSSSVSSGLTPQPSPSSTPQPQPSPSPSISVTGNTNNNENSGVGQGIPVPPVDPQENNAPSQKVASPIPQPPTLTLSTTDTQDVIPVSITPPVTLVSPTLSTPEDYAKKVNSVSYASPPTPAPVSKKQIIPAPINPQNRFLTPPVNLLEHSLRNTDYYAPLTISRNTSILLEIFGSLLVLSGFYLVRPLKVGDILYRFRRGNTDFGFQS